MLLKSILTQEDYNIIRLRIFKYHCVASCTFVNKLIKPFCPFISFTYSTYHITMADEPVHRAFEEFEAAGTKANVSEALEALAIAFKAGGM